MIHRRVLAAVISICLLNVFFPWMIFWSVNPMFGGSSQLPTLAERAIIRSNRRAQFGHSRKLGGAAEYLIDFITNVKTRLVIVLLVVMCMSLTSKCFNSS